MANYAMMIDFGSTYTKIVCASLTEKRLIRAGSFPSTVRSDARVNLEQCMEFARETLGKENLEQSLKLCSSSAAGEGSSESQIAGMRGKNAAASCGVCIGMPLGVVNACSAAPRRRRPLSR